MFPPKYIQDIAGENSPVAPFAKSSPMDRYAILYYDYDRHGKLKRLLFEDYTIYHGHKLDRRETVYPDGRNESAQYLYGKQGNLWKVVWQHSGPMPNKSTVRKVGRKYQKTDDVYVDGYLRERTYIEEKYKESYSIGQESVVKNNIIYCECVDEVYDEVTRYIEQYNYKNELVSRHTICTKLSNPADVSDDDILVYHYKDNKISEIQRILSGGRVMGRNVYSDHDARGNWQKEMKYLKFHHDDIEKLDRIRARELAYDEASAIELRTKFESLKTEMIVDNESKQL